MKYSPPNIQLTHVWQMCQTQNLEPKHFVKAYVYALLKNSYRCIGQALKFNLWTEYVAEKHGGWIRG